MTRIRADGNVGQRTGDELQCLLGGEYVRGQVGGAVKIWFSPHLGAGLGHRQWHRLLTALKSPDRGPGHFQPWATHYFLGTRARA